MKSMKKWLASDRYLVQIMGAMTSKWWRILTLFLLVMSILYVLSPINWQNCINNTNCLTNIRNHISIAIRNRWYKFAFLSLAVVLAFGVCNTLTNIYTLRKNENGITWCQMFILFAIGVWIFGVIYIFNLFTAKTGTVVFGILGGLLVWIFQDKVKGAVAFIHLRLHRLLSIGDWIMVPSYNVDGEVKRVSLTTVTVYNWDTTTSTLPISALHSDHFVNLQNMSDGKTYGRQMLKSFYLDTCCFHAFTKEEADQLKVRLDSKGSLTCLSADEIKEGALNTTMYRQYLYHWLMRHPHVSQQPRLLVRWLEQEDDGMPLQIYAFIIDSSLTAFEWQQSQIIEHVIESLDWFGLRLYQSPSTYDFE